MLGLGDYASSDEEADDEVNGLQPIDNPRVTEQHDITNVSAGIQEKIPKIVDSIRPDTQNGNAQHDQQVHSATFPSTSVQGPVMPDTMRSDARGLDTTQTDQTSDEDQRQLIRGLTMPPIPNLDIPSSPPGSPTPGSNQKFAHFLKLKQDGVHFNSKLESSSALRNPALLQKLMQFAQIDEYDQYATALPTDLAIPVSYPPWAYGDALNQTQHRLQKKKEEQQLKHPRDKVDFVAGTRSSALHTSHMNSTRKKAA